MHRRYLLAAVPLAAAFGVSALAQQTAAPPMPAAPANPPTRVRGSIAALNGDTLVVNSRDGRKLDITLSDPVTVVTVTRLKLDAIRPNDFIGAATRTTADGKQIALEVLVFPEAMRGTGEGHFPWDLQPGSMMTNGTVKGEAKAASGRQLTIGYKDSETTVDVPPNAPIVTFAPATHADLKPGARVFLIAKQNADGNLTATRVTVGKNGVVPPM